MRVHRSGGVCARKFLVLGVFVLMATVPRVAAANELIPYSFDERMNKSDDVVIGRALSLNGTGISTCCDASATIKVMRVLKGHPSHVVKVFTQNEVIDLDSRCCDIGKVYLFFLSMRPSGIFAIVDGRFGAIPLD